MTLKRQSLWSVAPLVVISAVNIFSVPLFYRYLGAELYALWFYVITFTGIFGFADLGLGVAVGRYIGVALGKGDHASVREYWGTGNFIAIPLLAFMAVSLAVIGVLYGPKWFNVAPANISMLRACFLAGGLGLFLNFYGQFWNILSQAHLDFRFSSLLRIAASVVQVIPAVGIASLTKNPFLVSSWAVLISAIQLAVFIWHSRRRYELGLALASARRARAREMAAYTGKTFTALLVGNMFYSIDRVILGKLANAADFTHYTIGANVGSRLQGLGTSVMGPVFHNTSRALGGGRNTASIYNETFSLVFEWYLLAALWAAAWHPVLLRLWLGQELALKVAPLFVPLIVACSINGIANISAAQLGALNRVGSMLGFTIAGGLMAIAGVWFGWRLGGVVGAAYGFLFSRLAFLAQDLFAIRLVGGGGWLSGRTWFGIAAQSVVAAGFVLCYLLLPSSSLWLLVPAVLHGGLVAGWLLRHPLRKIAPAILAFTTLRATEPAPRTPEP